MWISGVAGVRARLKSERSGFDSSGIHHAPVVQLAETLDLGSRCWGFESLQEYQLMGLLLRRRMGTGL